MSDAARPDSGTAVAKRRASARVIGVRPNLVTVQLDEGPVARNEIGHVRVGGARLMAEVLRVRGRAADLQVFEDTMGVSVGDPVELSGEMLSVTLGPGMLGQIYDGLQNPLRTLADRHGTLLPRGQAAPPLPGRKWTFEPSVRAGGELWPGDPLGQVDEGRLRHTICAPFDEPGPARLVWLEGGRCDVDTVIGELERTDGSRRALTLKQRWPVRRPLPEHLLRDGGAHRLVPQSPLVTTIRLIDSLFPIARGGTACIPGPFGAGKTVLQNLIARHAAVDVVIVVACGERAGEVVETLTEFPQLPDPRTGGSLMDRTLIVCNTSAMPVAAREASIYTGITLGEYYRHLGHQVLVIADSTSRWAQAMRETSGRMEEIPGDEAYPAYLDSAIRAMYERAGIVRRRDGVEGSLTLIGTVSPAGGNLDDPVTRATLSSVKAFLGLTAERAYRRCYPAVDPHLSWSRYGEQLRSWYEREIGAQWHPTIERCRRRLREAQQISQLIQVAGEDAVSIDDLVRWQQGELFDAVYLQQNAFDPVDASSDLPRQWSLLRLLDEVGDTRLAFPDRDAVLDFFSGLTALFHNLNGCRDDSEDFAAYSQRIRESLAKADSRRP